MCSAVEGEKEQNGLSFAFPLVVNTNRAEELAPRRLFGKEELPQEYSPPQADLLTEGDLRGAYFSARIVKVIFATFDTKPACLLLIELNFQVSARGVLHRFRDATVEVEFAYDGQPTGTEQAAVGPTVLKFAPEAEQGPPTFGARASTYGIGRMGGTMTFVVVHPAFQFKRENDFSQRTTIHS
ncbi:hypothetical protein GP486_002158 [Trichoglossum hirsutum]|uniref:Uncharacterized protein n=1 Tax=Trichoglossum hirsutum TaxID=265104 RepID=A0A9P8RSC5_9PEZI|nr:hypothetical protein GP486_002158 [Trichoglossum hirsutum]